MLKNHKDLRRGDLYYWKNSEAVTYTLEYEGCPRRLRATHFFTLAGRGLDVQSTFLTDGQVDAAIERGDLLET